MSEREPVAVIRQADGAQTVIYEWPPESSGAGLLIQSAEGRLERTGSAITVHFERHWAWADGALIVALIFVGSLIATTLGIILA